MNSTTIRRTTLSCRCYYDNASRRRRSYVATTRNHQHHHSVKNRKVSLLFASSALLLLYHVGCFGGGSSGQQWGVYGYVLRIASWNILAQQYVRHEKCYWTDPKCLDWDYRQILIVDTILNTMDADIVCLQEVDVDLFPQLVQSLHPTFTTDGIRLQKVHWNHNVATAVFVRSTCPLQIVRDESRSRAQIVVLKSRQVEEVGADMATTTMTEENDRKNNNGHYDNQQSPQTQQRDKYLYLCNVHLDAGANKIDPKLRMYHQEQRTNQLKSLLHRANLQYQKDRHQHTASTAAVGTTPPSINDDSDHSIPIIIAGDFNMLRSNPLHACLENGNLSNGKIGTTATTTGLRLIDTYLDTERKGRESKLAFLQTRPSPTTTTVTATDESKNHRHNVVQKTFRGGAILDYIWISDQVHVIDTLVYHPESLNSGWAPIPSKHHPSDHFPVGIDIDWDL